MQRHNWPLPRLFIKPDDKKYHRTYTADTLEYNCTEALALSTGSVRQRLVQHFSQTHTTLLQARLNHRPRLLLVTLRPCIA